MSFLKIQLLLVKCITATVFCLSLISCQGSKNDTQINNLLTEEDYSFLQEETMRILREDSIRLAIEQSRQKVEVPASFTPDSARQLAAQLDSIFHYLHKKKGFNGTVLVTKYGEVIYKNAFGFADFYRKDTLSTETVFQLASVSKQFTAMAIMMLKEQGRLHYDDSVQQHIPTFPYKGITIRQLLTHRSGLSNYTYFSDELWSDRKLMMTNQDVLNLMETHQPQIFYQPDTRFDYSNTGYCILASIVEKASNTPFATFLHEQIFEPLEMTHTFTFNDTLKAQSLKVATGHTGNRRKRTSDYLDSVLGDKGLYSTVEDLYKWDQALYTQRLVKRETLEEAFSGSTPRKKSSKTKKKKEEDYGFGWRIRELNNGDTAVFHAGLWHGYNTFMLRNPKEQSSFIVLSNLPNGSLKHVKDNLQEFLFPARPVSPVIFSNKENEEEAHKTDMNQAQLSPPQPKPDYAPFREKNG